ncbi:MAG: hypothetical protein RIS58_803 [Actinomycetota bacterium]
MRCYLPATRRHEYSIRVIDFPRDSGVVFGALGGTRTPNPLIRRQVSSECWCLCCLYGQSAYGLVSVAVLPNVAQYVWFVTLL